MVRYQLLVMGYRISHKKVHKLMKKMGIKGRTYRKYKRTTIQSKNPLEAPDLICQDFYAPNPNTKWCGDITYIRTWQGWAYMASVIDMHSRRLIGWAIDDNMRTELVLDALEMAVKTRRPGNGVIFHSDRGCQYTSARFDEYCKDHGIRRSLSRTGICFDNAVAESFFATYKRDLIYTRPWETIGKLKRETFKWIEEQYNRKRRHSSLGYLTPVEKELGYMHINELVA
jgi:transposase InsO family protein